MAGVIYDLKIGESYNFYTLAPSVIGAKYEMATLQAILDYSTASMYSKDLRAIHTQIYPSLKVGTPKNIADLLFVRIKTTTNEFVVLAEDWLVSQPTKVNTKSVTVDLTKVDINNISKLRSALLQNGFMNFEIKINT